MRKHKNRLSGFCDQVLELPGVADEDIDIATLLGIEPEARGVTQPCLVAQVVIYSYPPKSNSHLVLPEDVLGEMHEGMLTSVYVAFGSMLKNMSRIQA